MQWVLLFIGIVILIGYLKSQKAKADKQTAQEFNDKASKILEDILNLNEIGRK